AGGIILNGSISGDAVVLTTPGSAFDASGAISATTLSGTTGNGASLTGPNNMIGTLAAFDSSAGGTFNLEDKSPLTVTGKVAVPNGGFLAIEADTLAISGGTLYAPGGTVQLAPYTAMNAIALFGNGSAGAGTLAITKDDIGGLVAAVLQIGTAAGGPIIIGDATGPAVSVPPGLALDLVSGSGVTEIGALSVGELEGTVGSATLTAANNITTLGNFSASSGGFSLTEDKTIPLLVSGPVSVPSGQTIALTADGIALGSGGSLSAPNGTVTIASAKPGLSVDLTTGQASAAVGTFSLGDTSPNTAAISAATLAVGAADGGGITVTGAIALPDIGLLDLLSGGAVSETSADSLSVGTLTATVASANLTGNNVIDTLGAITATGGAFSLTNQVPLGITGAVRAVGNGVTFIINGGGNIAEQTGGSITAGTLTGSAGSASFNDANQVGTLGAFAATNGSFSLTETAGQPLAITGVVSVPAGQRIALTTDGIAVGPAGSLAAAGASVALASATPSLAVDVTTGRATASAGTFSLGDAVADTAAIAAATLAIGATSGGEISVTGPIALPDVALLDLLSGGALSETTADSLSVGAFVAEVARANLIGGNAIGTLGAITAPGGFTLTDEENLTLAGPIRATGGAVQLNDARFAISESGGSISAETLGIGAPTAVVPSASLTGNNVIGTLDAVSVSGGFTLANAENLTLAGAVNAGNVQLNDPDFAITEQGGSIETGFFTGSGASATLNGANQIGTLGAFAASNGGFSLTEAPGHALLVTGVVSVTTGQTIALTADGIAVGATGSLDATGGSATLASATNAIPIDVTTGQASAAIGTFSLGDPVSDTAAIAAATLAVGAVDGGALTVKGVIALTSVTLLDLLSGGALSETNADSLSVGTLAADVASASLIGSNAIGTLGAITATGDFTLADQENLTLAGPIRATGGAVQLNDPGFAITEQGGSVAADILGIGTPGSVVQSASLSGNNVIGTLDSVSVSGGFTLANAKDLTLAGLI
ncbi:MAG: beta strand repeat-containing protein, partial [Stellaceae bacterium]